MNKSIEEKRDILAEEHDDSIWYGRSHNISFCNGFDAGYALGLEQAKVLVEALEFYACANKRQGPDFITVELLEMTLDNGKKAREALKLFKEGG